MNVYFSGIGGVGIGPLAQIAFRAGYHVNGSDAAESPIVDELRFLGVSVAIAGDDTFLKACHEQSPIDWFVYTSALPDDHPELLYAKKLGIRCSKRDEFLAEFLKEQQLELIAVTGTHGKTTTTGMLVWVMKQLGIPVSYSVGTTISFGSSGDFDPKSRYFIYECDEYDRNFLQFSPELALIVSFDYDHPDTYPTQQSYNEAFRKFISQSKHTILWHQDAVAIDLPPSNISKWELQTSDQLQLVLQGDHNRRNATLVAKALEYLQLGEASEVIRHLESFPGTNRRFEKLADNLYTDYGHHPIEIAATLASAKELSEHLVVVYQPHQNRRQHSVQRQYVNAFRDAEKIYWLPTYLAREDPNQALLTPQDLIKTLANKQDAQEADLNDELWMHIQEERAAGKLVLCMGAGTIDDWVRRQLAKG